MNKEQILALAKELKSGSNWLSGKHNVYSYNRAPKIAALFLEAIAEYSIQHLVTALRDAHKWKLEGFGHYKDVTMSESDAPFMASDVIEASISAAIESYKAELLKEAGEPVAYGEDNDGWYVSIGNEQIAYELTEQSAKQITDQVASAIIKATKPLEDQLAAAQEEIEASSKDSLRLLESVKYLRGIAEHGEERQQREDETVEQFVLGYVKKLEDQLAKAEQRIAELIPGNGKELSERMKRLATNSVWRYSADQNKPVDMSDPNIQELFAIIDHLCIGLDSPANGASS